MAKEVTSGTIESEKQAQLKECIPILTQVMTLPRRPQQLRSPQSSPKLRENPILLTNDTQITHKQEHSA